MPTFRQSKSLYASTLKINLGKTVLGRKRFRQ
jgi:hypothetical protein